MFNRRTKFGLVLKRRTIVLFLALAAGFLGPRVFSQDTKPAATEATPAPATPAADATPAVKPPETPAYFITASTPDVTKKDDHGNLIWPDATGAAAGAWANPGIAVDDKGKVTAGEVPSTLTVPDVYDRVVHNEFSINFVWTLVTGFLVMFMQAGFAMVEGGLCRSKNSAHTFAMNFMVYPLGCFAFFVYGFALGWGNWYSAPVPDGWYASLGPGTAVLNEGWGIKGDADGANAGAWKYQLVGTKGFFLQGVEDVGVLALFSSKWCSSIPPRPFQRVH